jgi:hypothetical protein
MQACLTKGNMSPDGLATTILIKSPSAVKWITANVSSGLHAPSPQLQSAFFLFGS